VKDKLAGFPSAHGITFQVYPASDPLHAEPLPTTIEDVPGSVDMLSTVSEELHTGDDSSFVPVDVNCSDASVRAAAYASDSARLERYVPPGPACAGAAVPALGGSGARPRRLQTSDYDVDDDCEFHGESAPTLALPNLASLSLTHALWGSRRRSPQVEPYVPPDPAQMAVQPSAAGNASIRKPQDRNGRMRYHAGRPDLEALFDEVAVEAEGLGESRVALLVCGNQHMLTSCLRIARKRTGAVNFDAHYEAFGL
jgi:Ferric reductase NAD binding domain